VSESHLEKKSLGKGLEEVSNIFLSNDNKERQGQINEGLSALILRKEASCIHLVDQHSSKPKCRVFTFESEKHGVSHMDTISLSDAEKCKYFEPHPSMNTGKKENETLNGAYPDPDDYDCGVEESVSVYRRIAYPNTENAQKWMRKALFKYIEDGFQIRSISLRKTTGGEAPSRTEKREEITLLVKGP
jgi:hypothetical protein